MFLRLVQGTLTGQDARWSNPQPSRACLTRTHNQQWQPRGNGPLIGKLLQRCSEPLCSSRTRVFRAPGGDCGSTRSTSLNSLATFRGRQQVRARAGGSSEANFQVANHIDHLTCTGVDGTTWLPPH